MTFKHMGDGTPHHHDVQGSTVGSCLLIFSIKEREAKKQLEKANKMEHEERGKATLKVVVFF